MPTSSSQVWHQFIHDSRTALANLSQPPRLANLLCGAGAQVCQPRGQGAGARVCGGESTGAADAGGGVLGTHGAQGVKGVGVTITWGLKA